MPPRVKGRSEALHGTRYLDRDDLKVVKMPGELRDWKIKCVCGGQHHSCNNGWMRHLIEDKARPILIPLMNGDSVRLTPLDQKRIAAWATLKCMVSEYDIGSSVTTHHMQRKRLMQTQIPPLHGWEYGLATATERSVPSWHSMPFKVIPNPKSELDLNQPADQL